MRRIKLVLSTLVVSVAAFAAFSGPAVAQELDCQDAWGYAIECGGELYVPYDNAYPYYIDDYDDNDYPPFYSDYDYEDYEDYDDFVDDLEDDLDDYLDALDEGSWGWDYYGW